MLYHSLNRMIRLHGGRNCVVKIIVTKDEKSKESFLCLERYGRGVVCIFWHYKCDNCSISSQLRTKSVWSDLPYGQCSRCANLLSSYIMWDISALLFKNIIRVIFKTDFSLFHRPPPVGGFVWLMYKIKMSKGLSCETKSTLYTNVRRAKEEIRRWILKIEMQREW